MRRIKEPYIEVKCKTRNFYEQRQQLYAALSIRRNIKKMYILLDNSVAVRTLQTDKTSSSLRLTRVFYEVAQRHYVKVRLAPEHSKIIGNEDTDNAARTTLHLLPPHPLQPTIISLAYLRRLMQ